jgi:hypothetical protein
MIRNNYLRSSFFVLLFAFSTFIIGYKASAAIDPQFLQCAQSSGYWGGAGCLYDVTITTTPPTGCWFSNSDMQSGHGGGTYDISKLGLVSCDQYFNETETNGQVLTISSDDAGNENQCAITQPTYFEDNCTAVQPATLSVAVGNSCPAGGTWAFSPGGYNGQTMTVYVDSAGTNYSLSYNAPSGYRGTVTPSSQLAYPGGSYTFNVSCTPVAAAPTVTLTAANNPDQCSTGTTLSWSSQNATSCSASWTSSTGTSGSQAVKPSSSPQPYSITCTNGTENGSASVSVTSSDAVNGSCPIGGGTPSVNLTASPSSIKAGQSSTLTWSGSNVEANSCSTYWTSQTGTSGSQSVSPVSTTQYSIVCHDNTNNHNPVYGTTQVNVTPTEAVIFIYSNISSGGGTVNPGGLSGQGTTLNNYGYVTPDPTNGTTYTITPYTVPGYTFDSVQDGHGGPNGASALLFPGDSKFFEVVYDQNQQPGSYTLSNSGTSNATISNSNVFSQNIITATATGGTQSAATFSLTGAPTGVSYAFSPTACTPGCTSTITFTVAPSAQPGTYPLTVTGTPGNVTTGFNLVLSAPQGISSVSCSANPSVAKVGQSVTWTANVTGGTPPYTYSWSGSSIPGVPNIPTSNPYAITYSTVGTKTAVTTVTDSNGVQGTCQAGTAVVNISPTFQEF